MEVKLKDDFEYRNTLVKLRMLKDRFEELKADAARDPTLRELSMRSCARMIKQLREEIIGDRVEVLGLPGVSAIRSGQLELGREGSA